MEPLDFLRCFDLVVNLFSVPLMKRRKTRVESPKTLENRAMGHSPIGFADLSHCSPPVLPRFAAPPRTPRTASARPNPRRSAPKSPVFPKTRTLVLLVCCCDFRDGAERLIPSKSLGNAVIRAFPGLLCILRMCAPRRAVAVVRPRGREKSADRRRRILISRLLIIRVSVPRRKSPFPAYFKGFPAVSPLIPPYPAFLKYPVSPQ